MSHHNHTHATFQRGLRLSSRISTPHRVNEEIFESDIRVFSIGLHILWLKEWMHQHPLTILHTHPVVPAWFLLLQMWSSPGQPKKARPGRRCLPELCRWVHPTPPEPCRSQSRRWRRSAAWSGALRPHLRSFCSDRSLPPTAQIWNQSRTSGYWLRHLASVLLRYNAHMIEEMTSVSKSLQTSLYFK